MKILVAEKIAQEGVEVLKGSGIEVDVKTELTREELLECIGDYDGLIIRSVTKVNQELLEKAINLKVVGRAGNGVDNIVLEDATKYGVIVVNTPDSNTVSAAEHTIGLLLGSARNLPQASEHVRNGGWERSLFKGSELYGKILGVVGLGRIGSMVATRMQSFNMKVIAYDPYITDDRFKKFNVEKREDLMDLVREADFITVHTPKTEETLSMISREQFEVAKDGVRVVNCARGGIIDEAALYEYLVNGKVASAGIDVMMNEPNPDSPLRALDNVVITPHLGASTFEAQKNVGVTVAKQVINALQGEMVPNAVNLPRINVKEMEYIKPYLQLAENLGKLYYQLNKGAVEKVDVKYYGDVNRFEVKTITMTALKGIFEPVLKEKINYVNALYVAQNRGCTVTESVAEYVEDYHNMIEITITSKEAEFKVAGTILGKRGLRIVNVNGFEFEVEPQQHMIIAENTDKPGMIGKIGMVLGELDININTMKVSQNDEDKKAMMFLTVDNHVNKEQVDNIRKIDGILGANYIKL
ncbi:MAG: phosphoglycerate dehydrogenase [Firmicutes bacterium]|nr:phosphoglycerate dehydrogenase [Bacillota bacterium]